MKTQPAPPLKTKRPASALGLIWVGGGVLALLMVAVLIFFTNSGNAEGSVTSPTVHTTETQAVISAGPTRTPKATFTPSTSTSVSTPVSPTTTTASNPSTPKSVVSIGGTLAIPVVVGGQFKIYVTGFDGAGLNGPTPVTLDNARQPMFRRDGQALIVNGTSDGVFRGIFVTDAQGGAAQQLNDRGDAYWPVWSPEGDEIMFVDLNRARTLFRQNSQLARSEGDFNPVQANNINIVGNNIVWSDDNRLVFQGCAEWLGQFGECGIWVTNADLIEPIRLTTNGGLPTDAGRGWMTYMLSEDGDWDIYLISLDGGQSVNLTDNNSQDGIATIAPDGQSVAYISNESGNWAVWTITLSDRQKQKWFDLDPQRGTIDLNSWSEERMSWTP
jgi:Tol biopolymer transport system component